MFTNINSARFVLCTVVLAIFTFVYQMVVHGHLLMPYYNATPALWRPETDMQQMFVWCLVFKLVMGAVLTLLFTRNYENKGLEEGVRFGFYIGLLMGVMTASWFMILPISSTLAVAWLIDGIVYGILSGVVLAQFYRN